MPLEFVRPALANPKIVANMASNRWRCSSGPADLHEHTREVLAGVPPVVSHARLRRRLLAGVEPALDSAKAGSKRAGDDDEALADARVDVLAGEGAVRRDGQVPKTALTWGSVLIAPKHHDPLTGDAILVEVAQARHRHPFLGRRRAYPKAAGKAPWLPNPRTGQQKTPR